jgi:hypothetical protein
MDSVFMIHGQTEALFSHWNKGKLISNKCILQKECHMQRTLCRQHYTLHFFAGSLKSTFSSFSGLTNIRFSFQHLVGISTLKPRHQGNRTTKLDWSRHRQQKPNPVSSSFTTCTAVTWVNFRYLFLFMHLFIYLFINFPKRSTCKCVMASVWFS